MVNMYDEKYRQDFTEEELNHELWKDVGECKGYEEFKGLYEVSSLGRVRSKYRIICYKDGHKRAFKGRILKPMSNKDNYLRVCLYYKEGHKKVFVHRTVALAFLPNPNNYQEINHKDENPLNNRLGNLEWCTRKYNINYGNRNKKMSKAISKPVNQYDKQGNLVHLYSNARNASIAIKGNTYADSDIHKCCKG